MRPMVNDEAKSRDLVVTHPVATMGECALVCNRGIIARTVNPNAPIDIL